MGRTFMTDTATYPRVTHTLALLGHTDADDHSCNSGEDDDDVGVRFRVT